MINNRPPMVIVTGQPFTRALQARMFGPTGIPPVYNSTDVLSAKIIQTRQTVSIFNPSIAWLTTNVTTGNSQTGYGQGQVEVGGTSAQSALLMPTNSYTLEVWHARSWATRPIQS